MLPGSCRTKRRLSSRVCRHKAGNFPAIRGGPACQMAANLAAEACLSERDIEGHMGSAQERTSRWVAEHAYVDR